MQRASSFVGVAHAHSVTVPVVPRGSRGALMTASVQAQHVVHTAAARNGVHREIRIHPAPSSSAPLVGGALKCNSTYTKWCSSCACESPDRLLKGKTADTGLGNRLGMLLSFAAIGDSLGRRVVTFWPTSGNTGFKKHMGRRYYGSWEELERLVAFPRTLHFIEETNEDAKAEASTDTGVGSTANLARMFAKSKELSHQQYEHIELSEADEIPSLVHPPHLQQVWGHPHGTWAHWLHWSNTRLWPKPCVDRATFVEHSRGVLSQLRPRVDFRNPTPRSYHVLHLRRGDRGTEAQLHHFYPNATNVTWQSVREVTRRTRLPWLLLTDTPSVLPEVEVLMRTQIGAVLLNRTLAPEDASLTWSTMRDFFAIAASAGVVGSVMRSASWVDSTFSSMAALVGDIPILLSTEVASGGYSAKLQKLGNESGEQLRSYFFADQVDGFVREAVAATRRPYPWTHRMPQSGSSSSMAVACEMGSARARGAR